MGRREQLGELLNELDGVSLEALDAKAALLRRIDHKYALSLHDFAGLADRLRRDHQVLEIDGRRAFAYTTTYFDTADLRCFVDHIEDRVPRFKARSRLYQDTGECVFEVKLKRSADETDKRQIDYSEHDRHHLTPAAIACLDRALSEHDLEAPASLQPTLTTRFARITLAARTRSERLTCDVGVHLVGRHGDSVRLHPDLVLIETKSQDGHSPADRELERMSVPTISLSKYRVGMSLVGAAQRFGHQPGGELFVEHPGG